MTTKYEGYTIETQTRKLELGGWTASVQVYAEDRTGIFLDIGSDLTFASSDIADQAALVFGRASLNRIDEPRS